MQQLNFQGKTKEQEAIEFIQKHEPPEGYFLGFSGGKDSTVLYDLTKKSGVKSQAYYSATLKIWEKGKPSGKPWREETFEEFLSNWYKGK